MDKNKLLEKFNGLYVGNVDTNNNCYDCHYCHNCYCCHYCDNCYNCYGCLLCKNLADKKIGYWLLNKEVTKEEFEAAKKVMGY